MGCVGKRNTSTFMKVICTQSSCGFPSCSHLGEHEYACCNDHHYICHDTRCVPKGLISVANERPFEKFPTGWPIRCPSCDSWGFVYTSESTGNIRRYRCLKCNDMYLATWKGTRITSVMNEPQNTRMEQWDWARIVNRLPE